MAHVALIAALACADLNPHAVRFSAARLLDEHAWPAERQPRLFTPRGA